MGDEHEGMTLCCYNMDNRGCPSCLGQWVKHSCQNGPKIPPILVSSALLQNLFPNKLACSLKIALAHNLLAHYLLAILILRPLQYRNHLARTNRNLLTNVRADVSCITQRIC